MAVLRPGHVIVVERESYLYRTYIEFFSLVRENPAVRKGLSNNPMNTESVLTQTVEQLERMNASLAALRRELLPGQPKKFAILAEGPLEELTFGDISDGMSIKT